MYTWNIAEVYKITYSFCLINYGSQTGKTIAVKIKQYSIDCKQKRNEKAFVAEYQIIVIGCMINVNDRVVLAETDYLMERTDGEAIKIQKFGNINRKFDVRLNTGR